MEMYRHILCVCLLTACWLSGCAKDPFSLRDAEQPDGGGGTYHTPVDHTTAVENLRFAMIERNSANYEETYSASMEYMFDFLLIDRPDLGKSWGASKEDQLVRNMFGAIDTISLVWSVTPGQVDLIDDSTAVLYRTYTVRTSIVEVDSVTTEIFTGELTLHLERNSLDLWWIVRWEDSHLGEDLPAWSDLKSRYL